MTKEERHRHILQTAKRLFQERGYDNVTIADVIAASDIARGTFYLHFDSLETLLMTLFDEVVQETWRQIEPILSDLSSSVETCTLEVVRAVFGMFDRDPSMIAVFYSGGGQEYVRKKQEAMFDKMGGLLVKALERRHGTHIPHLPWTVSMVIALVADMSYYAETRVPQQDRAMFEQRLVSFVMAGLSEHIGPCIESQQTQVSNQDR